MRPGSVYPDACKQRLEGSGFNTRIFMVYGRPFATHKTGSIVSVCVAHLQSK